MLELINYDRSIKSEKEMLNNVGTTEGRLLTECDLFVDTLLGKQNFEKLPKDDRLNSQTSYDSCSNLKSEDESRRSRRR